MVLCLSLLGRTNHRVTANTEKDTEKKSLKREYKYLTIYLDFFCVFLCALCDSVVSSSFLLPSFLRAARAPRRRRAARGRPRRRTAGRPPGGLSLFSRRPPGRGVPPGDA